MALTFGWKGAADTDVAFSEFYAGDHTLLAWFLLQYPRAYAGPILSVNGTGTFVVGQGDFNRVGATGQAHLIARSEGARRTVLAGILGSEAASEHLGSPAVHLAACTLSDRART